MKIPFSPPYVDDDVKNEVLNSLDSGWITTGPKVKALEQEVCKYANVPQALCINSATSGMMLALHWYGVTRGDEVIIPAYTYAATALVVMHIGATPLMVDVNDDFNISVDNIRAAITPKTKAIIPVDFAGWACDYDAINALVNEPLIINQFTPKGKQQEKLKRILVMSDAAHSIGAVYKGKKTGALADITVFSFHAVKNLTTAEGGAICLSLPQPFDNEDFGV
jgi:dTDP-4-amino-4,6-dideoxygalactose transaminase